jgi:hypothetical protein
MYEWHLHGAAGIVAVNSAAGYGIATVRITRGFTGPLRHICCSAGFATNGHADGIGPAVHAWQWGRVATAWQFVHVRKWRGHAGERHAR